MANHAKDMVRAALAADSLALGVHWIYDIEKIRSDHGRVENLIAPGIGSYHSTKKRGEFTHYGDQMLVLLASISDGGFDPDRFFKDWQALFKDYSGYMDMATKATLKNIANGKGLTDCGSVSNDIAGAARIAPLVLSLRDDTAALEQAARTQTRMTHNDEATIDTAAFFARVCKACLDGEKPAAVIKEIANTIFTESLVGFWADQGLSAADQDSLEAVSRFGQSCHTNEAFSGVVQIIARYENDPGQGIVEAVMAGGDNAARASLVAQVLTAYNGADASIEKWFEELVQKDLITQYLDRIS